MLRMIAYVRTLLPTSIWIRIGVLSITLGCMGEEGQQVETQVGDPPICMAGPIPVAGCLCGGSLHTSGHCCSDRRQEPPCTLPEDDLPLCQEGAVVDTGCLCGYAPVETGYCCGGVHGEVICPDDVIDEDGDRYSPPADCNDNESSIHPHATEICGDGIDNDCRDGDVACADCPVPLAAIPTEGCICAGTIQYGGYCCDGLHQDLPCTGTGVDNDGDRFSPPLDCDDNDINVHPPVIPGSLEICGDGVDNDCDNRDAVCTPCLNNAKIRAHGCSCGGTNRYQGYCCDGTYSETKCDPTVARFAYIQNLGVHGPSRIEQAGWQKNNPLLSELVDMLLADPLDFILTGSDNFDACSCSPESWVTLASLLHLYDPAYPMYYPHWTTDDRRGDCEGYPDVQAWLSATGIGNTEQATYLWREAFGVERPGVIGANYLSSDTMRHFVIEEGPLLVVSPGDWNVEELSQLLATTTATWKILANRYPRGVFDEPKSVDWFDAVGRFDVVVNETDNSDFFAYTYPYRGDQRVDVDDEWDSDNNRVVRIGDGTVHINAPQTIRSTTSFATGTARLAADRVYDDRCPPGDIHPCAELSTWGWYLTDGHRKFGFLYFTATEDALRVEFRPTGVAVDGTDENGALEVVTLRK